MTQKDTELLNSLFDTAYPVAPNFSKYSGNTFRESHMKADDALRPLSKFIIEHDSRTYVDPSTNKQKRTEVITLKHGSACYMLNVASYIPKYDKSVWLNKKSLYYGIEEILRDINDEIEAFGETI